MGLAGYIKMFVAIGIFFLIARNPELITRLGSTFNTLVGRVVSLGGT